MLKTTTDMYGTLISLDDKNLSNQVAIKFFIDNISNLKKQPFAKIFVSMNLKTFKKFIDLNIKIKEYQIIKDKVMVQL